MNITLFSVMFTLYFLKKVMFTLSFLTSLSWYAFHDISSPSCSRGRGRGRRYGLDHRLFSGLLFVAGRVSNVPAGHAAYDAACICKEMHFPKQSYFTDKIAIVVGANAPYFAVNNYVAVKLIL